MMTAEERVLWLEERKTGIGGSECASLLSHILPVKYGCRRRLWMEKSGQNPDYEFEDLAHIRLGRYFEGPICDLYAAVTGRRIESLPRMIHPDHPELGVSIDRLIHAQDQPTPGVLEAKSMMSRNFYEVRRSGLESIPDYLLQAQHGILVASADLGTDIQWCSYVVGKSDDPKLIAFALEWHLKMDLKYEMNPSYLIHFDIPRNQEICDAILREGPALWRTIGNPELIPERLPEPDDPRCGRCRYRDTCRGASLLPPADDKFSPAPPELIPLAVEYLQRKELLDEAENLVDETKEQVMTVMGERQAVQVMVEGRPRPLYYRPQDGRPRYGDAVKDMGEQYRVMRERLIQIEKQVSDLSSLDIEEIKKAVAGAELIPMLASYVKKGKPFRSLMMQYLSPKAKEE